MEKIDEGNVFNVETNIDPSVKDRSKNDLSKFEKIIADQFWEHMLRQGIDPAKAKKIAKSTFGNYKS